MRSTAKIAYFALTILSTGVGCELIARVDRGTIPDEGSSGGSAGAGESSSSSSSASSSSGQAGMGGSGGSAGMGGAGGGTPCTMDADCPATGTVCALPHCNAGTCEKMPATAGTVCSEGAGTMCDGQGQCVQCIAPTDCPKGGPCKVAECNAGVCGLVDAMAGTEVSDPTPGDCKNEQCDATGAVVTGNDDTDVPVSASECEVGSCSMGMPTLADAPMGTMCGAAMNTTCDGMGNCVGCMFNTDCGMPTECTTPTCTNATCINNFAPQGQVLMTQMANDCMQSQCDGNGGIVQVPDDTDFPPPDMNDCTEQSCSAGMPNFPPSSVGTPCNSGNGVCDGNAQCVECNIGVDCDSGICSMNMCQPPEVMAIAPADMATNAVVTSSIAVTFTGTMNATTLVGQTTLGPCTGSIQISVDDFATCYPFASAAATMSPDNKTATLTPAPGLSYGTRYKVKVTTGAQDTSGKALAADFVQMMGFVTEVPQSTCSGSVVISQIYTAGGANGATYTHDFVELHNRGNTAVSVDGWTLQTASQSGSVWSGPALTGMIPPGGYYLIQLGSSGAIGMALPTPNVMSGVNLSPNAGKVALVSSTTLLTGGCPTGAQIRDYVGYGNTGCFEGAASAPQPSTTQSIFRKGAGCTDTGQNGADTELLNVAPRNNATMALQCDCPIAGTTGTANESDISVELDYCNVQFPTDIMVMAGQMTPAIFGRVYEAGFTEAMGANAAITAEVGFGPANVNPENQSGFQFFPATFNLQSGNDDEYMAMFAAPMTAGSYRYVYRFTRDGVSWTYCDKNGAGSNGGLSFEVHELPVLTVMP